MAIKNKFYRTSQHSGVGSTVMFWAINGGGYVSDLEKAHIYTHEEAQSQVDMGHFGDNEFPISVEHVDSLSMWRVDHQYLDPDVYSYPTCIDQNDEYVAYKKQCWDGNDLGFASISGLSFTFDYSSARTFNAKELDSMIADGDCDSWVFVAKSATDDIARRTFQFKNINRRKMILGAGIIGVKKKTRRSTTGKTRWNCPECGRISWQHNPYHFAGCADFVCSGYKELRGDY